VDISDEVHAAVAHLENSSSLQVDLSDRMKAANLVNDIAEEAGRLDIMVNAAGITRDAFIHKMTDEQWDQVLAVNLTAVFTTTRASVRIMRSQREGRIINIASAGWLGNYAQANYAAAKAGVVGLTLSAARELGRSGATANAVCPGFIETDMTRKIPQQIFADQVQKIWLGRVGQPEDVANTVTFLASAEGGYITGEILNVGGGYKL
jgi:3-oxoacyl-[acyl-carrier protein] reductase/2-hydroxycyclohexanecarboxyl-CoA dehydrogenase